VGVSRHTTYTWKATYGGRDVGQAQEAKQLRYKKHTTAEAGGGSDPGQRSAAVGDKKKRLEFVALKAAIGQMRAEYAFSERQCQLMTMAVSSYRYETTRSE